MTQSKTLHTAVAFLVLSVALAGCTGGSNVTPIAQAGSSTVFPIAEAWAAELAAQGIQVTVAGGGSGRGASAICAGEIDIGDMSRMFKQSELDTCAANSVDPVTWKVAFDGITVVVPKSNDFVDHLTVEELRHIWRAEAPAMTWADVREGWPAQNIVLYGPDTDSGTFEYFNEEILGTTCGDDGKSQCPIRNDFTPSADDNVLVEGVTASNYAIGHFGFAYFVENQDRLRGVPIAEGDHDPVAPEFATIADGSYAPLSRPIFMVTNGKPAPDTPLHAYFEYAMGEGQKVVREVGYVELDAATLETQRAWL